MLDFPFHASVQKVGAAVYENGGVVGAVCHGPIALCNIKLSNGDLILKGKEVTGFCNEEEDAAGLWDKLPEHEGGHKSCEQVMTALGGNYQKGGAWSCKVS